MGFVYSKTTLAQKQKQGPGHSMGGTLCRVRTCACVKCDFYVPRYALRPKRVVPNNLSAQIPLVLGLCPTRVRNIIIKDIILKRISKTKSQSNSVIRLRGKKFRVDNEWENPFFSVWIFKILVFSVYIFFHENNDFLCTCMLTKDVKCHLLIVVGGGCCWL